MTKKEIYTLIGYTGSYTKEVKKRLRQLCKKYHPDLYHGDDSVMKLLNQVKEEIKNNPVEDSFYQYTKPYTEEKKETVGDELDSKEDIFRFISVEQLQQKIEKLKNNQQALTQNLKQLNHEAHLRYEVFREKVEIYERSKIHIVEKKKERKFPWIPFTIASSSIVFLLSLLSIIFQTFLPLCCILLLFFLLTVYGGMQYKRIQKINQEISIEYAFKSIYFQEAMSAREKIEEKEKEYSLQYKKYRQTLDDIQLYYYEMSKKQESSISKQKGKESDQRYR